MANKKSNNPFSSLFDTMNYNAAEDDANATGYLKASTGAYDGIRPPTGQSVDLKGADYVGDVDPRLVDSAAQVDYQDAAAVSAGAVDQGRSGMNDVAVDPRLKQAQMASLSALQDLAANGGLNAEDKANLAKIQSQSAQADRGRRDAILQNMQARGMGGSGSELLAQLQSSQAATDRQSQEGLDIAGMAQARQRQAIMDAGGLGGSIRNQDFGEQAQVASANDAIDRFNAQNRTGINQFNAGQTNNMTQFNAGNTLQNAQWNAGNAFDQSKANAQIANSVAMNNQGARQGVSDKAAAAANQNQMINNVELPQSMFDNQAKIAAGKAGAAEAGVNYYGKKQEIGEKAKGGALGSAVALGAAAMSDKRAKKDIAPMSDDDIADFLRSIKPKTYTYKDESNGVTKGTQPGFLADDLATSKIGRMIVAEDKDGLKHVDQQKLQGATLAALQFLAKGKV